MAPKSSKGKKREAIFKLMRSAPEGEQLYEILLGLSRPKGKFDDPADTERAHDRNAAIVGATFVERGLAKAIKYHLKKDDDDPDFSYLFEADEAPLRDLAARSKVARALGVIDKAQYEEIQVIRYIRNAFAHAPIPISFRTEAIVDFCHELKSVMENEIFIRYLDADKPESPSFQMLGGYRALFGMAVFQHFWNLSIYPGFNFLSDGGKVAAVFASIIDK